MSQIKTLYAHLKKGKEINRATAFRQYGIADLRSRISDIERLGITILRGKIPGKKYVKYYMTPF